MTVNLTDKSLLIVTPEFPSESNSYIGGSFIKTMVNELTPHVKRITVISPVLQTMGAIKKDKLCHDYSYGNVKVYFPRCFYIPNLTPGKNSSWKNKMDFRYYSINKTIVDQEVEFDLIHAQFNYMSGHASNKLHMKFGKPYVVSVLEDPIWFQHLLSLNDPNYVAGLTNAKAVIGINQMDTEHIRVYNKNAEYIPMGFNDRLFKPIKTKQECKVDLGLQQPDELETRLIISIGQIEKRKRLDLLVDAVSQLARDDSNHFYQCIIIGHDKGEKGAIYDKIRSSFKYSNLLYNFADNVSDAELVKYINAADIVTVQSDSEGFGITQVESFGCGTPVVASDNQGSIDLINTDTGFLFGRGNVNDFAVTLKKALDHKWDRMRIYEISKRYAWGSVINELKTIYSKALQ